MTSRIAAAALAALLLAPVSAFAQAPAAPAPAATAPAAAQGKGAGPLEACRADVDKLCATAEKAQGWRGKCLRDNAAKLSDGCKAAVAALREQRKKVRAACTTDLDTLCKAAAGAEAVRPMSCLKTNEAKLSAGCKSALASFTGDVDGDAPAAKQ